MLKTRVIPCLLLDNNALIKTVKFKNPTYIGDPLNAIRIYNEKEVDELMVLDIFATSKNKRPSFKLIADLAAECFMPLAYGGGIKSLDDAKELFQLGIEKIVLSTASIENPKLITEIAKKYGNQAVVVCIDYKKNFWGKIKIFTNNGEKAIESNPVEHAKIVQDLGAGEILLYSIERDGTFMGYDIEMLKKVTEAVNIPVIACGGAGKLEHFKEAVNEGGASAVAAGSMVVYQGANKAVLINYPAKKELKQLFYT